MPAEILITEIVDVNGSIRDLGTVLKEINKLEQAILAVNKNPVNLGGIGSMKELRDASAKLTQSLNQLNATVSGISKVDTSKSFQQTANAQKETTKATNENISAYQKLKTEVKEAEVNAKNLATQFGVDSKEALDAAASYEVLREKLAQVNSVTKAKPVQQAPFDPNSVPFTSNIDQQNQELEKTGQVVNKLEEEYAALTNEVTAWSAAQKDASGQLESEKASIAGLTGEYDAFTGSLRQNLTAQIENNLALQQNRASQKQVQADIKNSPSGASDAQIQKLAELREQELLLIETNKNLSTTIRNQAKDFISAEGSIDEMRAKLSLLQVSYEQLSAAEKLQPFGVSIKSQIDVLDPTLKKAEGELGKFQRNVGNYGNSITKAFSGAFSYLRQIAYIIPGLGIAGIISLLSDGIVSLISKIASSKKTLTDAERDTKILNQVNEKAVDIYSKEVSKLEVLRLKLTTLSKPQEERIALANEYNKAADVGNKIDTTQINNINLLNSAIDRQIGKIKERALAEAAANVTKDAANKLFLAEQKLNEIDDKFALDLNNIDELIKKQQTKHDTEAIDFGLGKIKQNVVIKTGDILKALISIKEANDDFTRSAKLTATLPTGEKCPPGYHWDSTKNACVKDKTNNTDENDQIKKDLQARFDLYKLEKERELELLNDIVNDDNAALSKRIAAAALYVDTKQKLILNSANFEKKISKSSGDEAALIDKKAAYDRIRVAEDMEKKLLAIQDRLREKIKSNAEVFSTIDVGQNSIYTNLLRQLDEYKKKQEVIAETEKKLSGERKQRVNDFIDQMKNAAFEFATFSIETQKNQIQDQIDTLEAKKQKDIELANQSILNAQDRAAAITVIEARAAAQKEQLEKRNRQLDVQKAKIERDSALLSIAIDAARQVFKIKSEAAVLAANPITAAYAPIALAQIPLVLISAAVAAALIAAKPLPKYFKGKNVDAFTDKYEGPALVDDGGKPEAIIRENGEIEIGTNRPRVTYLKANDIVLPDANMLALNATKTAAELNYQVSISNENEALRSDVRMIGKNIVTAIKSQPKQRKSNADDLLLKAWIKSDLPWREFLRR